MTERRTTRSQITRATLLRSAGTEFEHYGYGGGSINRTLNTAEKAKGTLYFHFKSKFDLAEAVLDEAEAVYTAIGKQWCAEGGIDPLDAITFMVRDAAHAYDRDSAVRAEAKLTLEPVFSDRRPTKAWQNAVADLALRAHEMHPLGEGFTAEKFAQVLATMLAGQRYMAQMVPVAEPESIQGRYGESLDVVFAAAGIDGRRRP